MALKPEASLWWQMSKCFCSPLGLCISFFLLAPGSFMANGGAWVHGEVVTRHISRASFPWYLVNSNGQSPFRALSILDYVVPCPSSRAGPVAAMEVLLQEGCEEFRQQKASSCCSLGSSAALDPGRPWAAPSRLLSMGTQDRNISAQYRAPLTGNLCSSFPHHPGWDFLKAGLQALPLHLPLSPFFIAIRHLPWSEGFPIWSCSLSPSSFRGILPNKSLPTSNFILAHAFQRTWTDMEPTSKSWKPATKTSQQRGESHFLVDLGILLLAVIPFHSDLKALEKQEP